MPRGASHTAARVGDAGVFLEDGRRCAGASLHAVDHDHVSSGLGGQLHVVEGSARAQFQEMGTCPSVASRSSSILMTMSSGPSMLWMPGRAGAGQRLPADRAGEQWFRKSWNPAAVRRCRVLLPGRWSIRSRWPRVDRARRCRSAREGLHLHIVPGELTLCRERPPSPVVFDVPTFAAALGQGSLAL